MEVKTGVEAETTASTLLIRHLPEAIPHDTLSRLFSHYGATSVRPCSAGRLKNCAFVDFKNEPLAYQAQCQLNGLRFLGKVLAVERARKQNEDNQNKENEMQLGKDYVSVSSMKKDHSGDSTKSVPASEPIAPRLGVDYPFPPHLEYAYPPPDGNILTNIVNALIAVPRFYTQVLHLMNKMNIPAPFRMALPTPPLPPSAPAPAPSPPPPPAVATKRQLADLSSSESEMESDEDVDGQVSPSRAAKPGRKRVKRASIVGPAFDKDVVHEDVGVKPSSLVPKEIPVVKKKTSVLQIKIVPKVIQHEQKDDSVMEESEEPAVEGLDHKPYASPEEIESNKLAPEDILSLPKFKNYTVGNPSSVLYIKNLSKDIVADDFFYIFGSLFGSTDAAKSDLEVKLMKEGRMRDQAFVTFPSAELAHQALNLVNGYVFKGKPMIMQFGRNPSAASAK